MSNRENLIFTTDFETCKYKILLAKHISKWDMKNTMVN
uniref:Uncharacterized protein n=1 Tax=Anguilla anguilla TaxID=7936 RepID=A0A0E9PTQ7_ANGAN